MKMLVRTRVDGRERGTVVLSQEQYKRFFSFWCAFKKPGWAYSATLVLTPKWGGENEAPHDTQG